MLRTVAGGKDVGRPMVAKPRCGERSIELSRRGEYVHHELRPLPPTSVSEYAGPHSFKLDTNNSRATPLGVMATSKTGCAYSSDA